MYLNEFENLILDDFNIIYLFNDCLGSIIEFNIGPFLFKKNEFENLILDNFIKIKFKVK